MTVSHVESHLARRSESTPGVDGSHAGRSRSPFNRRLTIVASVMVVTSTALTFAQPPSDLNASSTLPMVGTDQIVLLDEHGRSETVRGNIVGIQGDRISIRTNGRGQLKIYSLALVQSLNYYRPIPWQEGLEHEADGRWQEALAAFERALAGETRDWAWCELQALAAATEIRRGTRWQAVDRIHRILEKDADSRHVGLLPLVWDADMSPDHRLTATADDLRHPATVHRLAAASALLSDEVLRTAALVTLKKVQQAEQFSRVGRLAAAQTWRLPLIDPANSDPPVLNAWREQVDRMPLELRHGPLYVVARLTENQHDYDQAAADYLWLPLMNAPDPALAARSLHAAICCLKQSGRPDDAVRLTTELNRRFAKFVPTVADPN